MALSVCALRADESKPAPAAAVPVAGEVVELPKFVVTDSRDLPPPEAWRYATIPGFEILANTSDRTTKRFVRDFLLLQTVVEVILPIAARVQNAAPTTLILCGRGNSFDRFVPAVQAADSGNTNSLFFNEQERTAIVIDFVLQETTRTNGETEDVDTYRSFYKEYFRHLVRQLAGTPPAWLEEGLVQLFSAVDFDRRTIDFGRIGDGFGGTKTGDFNQIMARGAILPMAELFGPRPTEGETLRLWRALNYEFVHLCLYGNGKRLQKPFVQFVIRASAEPPTEAMFKECFGKSYKDMELELRGYAEFTAHESVEFRAKKGHELPEPPPVALRDATEAEVGRLKGETLRLAGHAPEAHLALIAPYIRGERDPALLASLGLDEAAAGHDDRARKFLEAAAQAKVVRPRALVALARLRLAEMGREPLDSAHTAELLRILFTARQQVPRLPEVYEAIADVWERSAVTPLHEHYAVVLEGVRFFPRRAELVCHAAELAVRYGFNEDALALLSLGNRVAPDDATRLRLARIRVPVALPASP